MVDLPKSITEIVLLLNFAALNHKVMSDPYTHGYFCEQIFEKRKKLRKTTVGNEV